MASAADVALFNMLAADGGVAAEVEQRIYPQLAPPDAPRPFVAYQRVQAPKQLTCAIPHVVRVEYEIDCVADSHLFAVHVADLVDAALHGNVGGEVWRFLVTDRRDRCEPRPGTESAIDYATTVHVSAFIGGI
jgi:hypothetical protein